MTDKAMNFQWVVWGFANPIAYHFDGLNVFFGTPRDSSKLRFLRGNPDVAFRLDYGNVMEEAIGIIRIVPDRKLF
jgi:hypothetical protein